SNLTLSAPTGRSISPSFGSRRSSSRGSNSSAGCSTGSGSSDEGDDSIFSSTDSLSSSGTSVSTLWKADNGSLMDGEFKYPPIPARPSNFTFPPTQPALHQRSHSSTFCPTASPFGAPPPSPSGRSLPSSPTKPRRRGTRGGGSSAAHHASTSSISSISSSTSSSTSTSRTREQAMAGTLTEHSGGKVGVLGGGVLLGLASAKMMGNARAEVVGEAKRRGRERRKGGAGMGMRTGGWEGMGHFGQPAPGQYFHAQHAGGPMVGQNA
ncbi:hypothetical protein P7C70_g4015, partial [Phenoliferia sp. Uapishka_3]